jgi:predicted nucleic-acid-binding protein
MIGLDTNVLVRYIIQDDVKQSPLANRLIESLSAESQGFIPIVVIVELVWVLSDCYALQRDQLTEVLQRILRTRELLVERAEIVWGALRLFHGATIEFADCIIATSSSAANCERTMTFDRGAAKKAGMTLITDTATAP